MSPKGNQRIVFKSFIQLLKSILLKMASQLHHTYTPCTHKKRKRERERERGFWPSRVCQHVPLTQVKNIVDFFHCYITTRRRRRIKIEASLLRTKMWLIILSFVFIVVLYWRTYKKQYPPGFPPGPRHFLPYLGDPLFAIGKDSLVGFTSMHKKFGAIVGFNIGGLRVISINDQDILQKVEEEARNDPKS